MATTLFQIGCLLLSTTVFAGGVTISPSNEDAVICAQDNVTFTCTLESASGLRWVAEPFITREKRQVAFAISDMGSTKTLNIDGVTFHAVLTQSEPVQGSSTHYTLQSTLSTTASTTTNGTVIECIDRFTEASNSSTLQLQILPPEPSNIYYNVTSYGTSEVTGDTEWSSSMDSSVDNFTITVSSLEGTTDLGTVASSPLEHVTLNYNTNYTISVIASNCAGSSKSAVVFMKSGCPPPDKPMNGSVSGFTSAKVGSNVTYHCAEGLNLVGGSVAVCTLQLVWEPMGLEVMCKHSPGTVSSTHTPTPTPDPNPSTTTTATTTATTTTTTTNTNHNTNTTTTISSSQSLVAGAVAGIVVAVLFPVFVSVVSVVIFVLLRKRFNISKKCGRGYENGAATGNSYTAGEEIVELQQVRESTVVPATYSAVGNVQESPSMEVVGTYSVVTHSQETPSSGVPTTYSSVVHVQAGNGTTPHIVEVKTPNKGLQYAELVPIALRPPSPPVALLINTHNKVQYSTVDHSSKAPAHPIDRSIDPEQIQLQLVEVRPQWRRLGSAVGLPTQFLDEVRSSYEEDKDRLAEVVYEWCNRVQSICWADVAAMCRNISHSDLANALDKAYQTGILPVDNDSELLPLTPSFKALPPPPLPPRERREESPPELPPPPTPDALEGLLPPNPPTYRQLPPPLPQKPHTAEAPVPPPRPPRKR